MDTPSHPVSNGHRWPTDKLNALRLGERLVTEVFPSALGRRAFRLHHREYDAGCIAGFDHDIGAALVRAATAGNEAALISMPDAWNLGPDQFHYPRQTDDPT